MPETHNPFASLMEITKRPPIVFVEGHGSWLKDRDGKEYLDFSSNDYLGLSEHPELREESKKAIDQFGCGSSASRLMSGDLELHHQLEREVARFKNKESALVFN